MSLAHIRQVAEYCYSRKFMVEFKLFFEDNAALFRTAPPTYTRGEQKIEHYAAYQEYVKLFEDTLTAYLASLSITPEEFFNDLRTFQGTTEDQKMCAFIDYLLAATDYERFYGIMMREQRTVHLPCGRPRCGTCAMKAGKPLPVVPSARPENYRPGNEVKAERKDFDEMAEMERFERGEGKGSPSSMRERERKAEGKEDDASEAKSPDRSSEK